MINNTGKEVAVVVVFTGYTDGTVDFSQDATRKDFGIVKRCLVAMMRHLAATIGRGAKCPFNPDNPDQFRLDVDGGNSHFG